VSYVIGTPRKHTYVSICASDFMFVVSVSVLLLEPLQREVVELCCEAI
jgi:hypothetical protein